MLIILYFLLVFSILVLFLLNDSKSLRFYSIVFSKCILICSCKILALYNCSTIEMQHLFSYYINFDYINVHLVFGLDGISIFFFVLSSFLIFLCVIFVVMENKYVKFYLLNLFIIQFFLLIVFSILDILLFYIFFEAILIPMYLIIGVYGSRDRKTWAAYMLFFYTLCGSLLFLLGIVYIYIITGTFNIEYLLYYKFTDNEQFYLWLAFFLSFASKIPVFPLHIWLPEAHVEAPTVGSVLLAGILLKLGVYGFIRFSLPMFPIASLYFSPFVHILCTFGIIYTSLTAIRQIDLKRIIAYSSVAHMNLIVMGLFSFNFLGVEGALLQSISHGFVASGLFFIIGMVYIRYQSRFIYFYGGMADIMPICCSFFLIFSMANIALPGTSSFVGEFLMLMGIFKLNFRIVVFIIVSVVLCGSYTLWVFNRFSFGRLKYKNILSYSDLITYEILILIPLVIFIFILGIFPYMYLTIIHSSIIFTLIDFFN